MDDRGTEVRFPAGLEIFFLILFRQAQGLTFLRIQWVPGGKAAY